MAPSEAPAERTLPRFPWTLWLCVSAAATLLFSFTLTTAVPVWMDEAMIVEYGRVALHADPGFSANQRSTPPRALEVPSTLGPALLEWAYRATMPSNAGPRAMALAGQLLAFGLLVYYLRLSGVAEVASAALGVAYLLDPLCDISWRGGRVDSWEFAAVFGALAALRRARGSSGAATASLAAAGAAAVAGLAVWPSFGLLLPLAAWEAWPILRPWRAGLARVAWIALGAGAAALLYCVGFGAHIARGLDDARYLSILIARHDLARGPMEQTGSLLSALAFSPVVAVMGLAAMRRPPARWLGLVSLVPLALVFATIVYRLRVVYLMPYFYVAASTLFQGSASDLRRRAGWIGLAAAIALGVGFTAAGTTMSGWSNRDGKDPLRLVEVARREIGAGPLRVWLEQPDFYYAGRALGWQQLYCVDGCYGASETPWESAVRMRADAAIVRASAGCPNVQEWSRRGYLPSPVVFPEGGVRSRIAGFEYGPPTYGPYCVFRRASR